MQWWKILIGIVVLAGLGWMGWVVSRPVTGTRMDDQGREHVSVEQVTAYQYNSNPPTSGPHLPTWVKAGVYDKPQSEGELIHSLEHGYVIVNYNCDVHVKVISDKRKVISNIYAHEEEGASQSAQFVDPMIATGSATNETDGCKMLVKKLTELANRKKLWKLVVVPRPQLDTTIALTAWTYLDKFDQFDEKRIEHFIDYHRDGGPEKTME